MSTIVFIVVTLINHGGISFMNLHDYQDEEILSYKYNFIFHWEVKLLHVHDKSSVVHVRCMLCICCEYVVNMLCIHYEDAVNTLWICDEYGVCYEQLRREQATHQDPDFTAPKTSTTILKNTRNSYSSELPGILVPRNY